MAVILNNKKWIFLNHVAFKIERMVVYISIGLFHTNFFLFGNLGEYFFLELKIILFVSIKCKPYQYNVKKCFKRVNCRKEGFLEVVTFEIL